MIAQYPAAYLMQKLPIAKVLGFATLGWGIVLMTVRCLHLALNKLLLVLTYD